MFIEIEEMMMISVWIWWTYWVIRAIDFKFYEKRRRLEAEQKKEKEWADERARLN